MLLVAVSRSGMTTETLRAVEVYQEKRAGDGLAITCASDSLLATKFPHVLVASGADELSVAQTRSFTTMYVLSQTVAVLTAGSDEHIEEIRSLPNCGRRLISEYEPLARSLADNPRLDHFVFLGSAHNYGLACEAMLKMKEMSLSCSEAYHFLEFRHGPKSVVTRALSSLAF